MAIKNIYNQFTDTPVDKAWFLRFDVLMLKNIDHRKILNRQPSVRIINKFIAKILFNAKVMSN